MDGILKLEHQVPKLPVPPLNESLQQALAALKPLTTLEEYDELLQEASACLADERIALIQQHLEAAARNEAVGCYLSALNGDSYPGIYGDLKGGILPRNPYLVLEEDPYASTINPPNQAQRAASLLNSSLKFMVSMRNGTLKPDLTPKSGKPLTMNCYRNLFGTTRIPDADHQVTIRKYRHINDSRHVVFLCNNQFYTLEVLSECVDDAAPSKHELWFNDTDLAAIIQEIIDESSSVDPVARVNNGIGSITTQTYTQWRNARGELHRSNEEALEKIDDALMVVVLDCTASPETDQEKTQVISFGTSQLAPGSNIQVGSCTSRWYDKLQLVVTTNAVAGVVWESSSMDSTAILRFISDIYTDSILKLARNINGAENTLFDPNIRFASQASGPKPQQRLLNFKKTPELQTLVHLSETRLADLIHQHEYKTLTMKLDSHLLSKFDISPDSFLQIGFQIANYALYGHIANTSEPITTRKFRDARTELIAVQSDTIDGLVKMFISSSDDEKKWELFKSCCHAHTQQYRAAMAGKGFERHIGAILQVLKKPSAIDNLNELNYEAGVAPLPPLDQLLASPVPFFKNPSYEKLRGAELLISNCGNPALRLFGIPPAMDQGFGVGYIIHKDKVVVTVSSKHRQTERFLDTFKSVVSGIKAIVSSQADLLLESADTEVRKEELKRLRIQKELSKVDLSLPSTRHPIDIKLSATPTTEQPTRSRSNSGNDDYSYLGGYGYFDGGSVATRSDELSQTQSFLNSPSHFSSRLGSQSTSRHQSSTSLAGTGRKVAANDVRMRLSMSERIRDKLSPSANASSTSLSDMDKKTKPRIGRAIGQVEG